jgi:uncharacterized membrane protein YbhN (UPF0104 family)
LVRSAPNVTPPTADPELPSEAQPRKLRRRAIETIALLAILVAVVVFTPGLGEARRLLADASPGWLLLGVVLEALSGCSYVVMFRPVFCRQMSWRSAWEISWAELGMGSIVPASGAGGLALGAWILRRRGMPLNQIARRSVSFFLLKSGVNFAAVAVIGTLFAIGVIGPSQPWWRTALPAALAVITIVAVLAIGSLDEPAPKPPDADRWSRAWTSTRRALVGGVREARALLRAGNLGVLLGSFGYWAFDNFVLWATYHAVGASPPLSVILMGYLIGQLGGLLPIPGGVGGIDLGLVGTLIVFGAPAQATVAAVLAYRLILFWLPLIVGGVAFWSLRRSLDQPQRPDLCVPQATAS